MKAKESESTEIKESTLQEVERLVTDLAGGQKAQRLISLRELFKASVKLAMESPGTLNLKIAATVLKELRYSFKMFYRHRFTPKITIFGSARVPRDTPVYDLTKDFAEEAARRKYMIITGGGPGVMAAGNEGAKKFGSFGLNIRLPMEQEANPFVDEKDRLIHYKYFFTRKLFLVKEASAFALFPGGFGTLDETFEALTLIQTGKSNIIPVLFIEPEGYSYWENFLKFVDAEMLSRGLISEADKSLYHVCHGSKEAMDHIDQFYKNYHSMRLVKDKLVVRIKKPLSDAVVKKINQQFKDLAMGEEIIQGGPVPQEANEPEIKDLSRIILKFDRSDFSGVRLLIDFINENTV